MSQSDIFEEDFEIDSTLIEPDTRINLPPRVAEPPQTQTVANGERLEQRTFTGGDTIDEPVWKTILRDLKSLGRSILYTVGWKQEESAGSREWNLWGPLFFYLQISLFLSLKTGTSKSQTFSNVFFVILVGHIVTTVNIKLIGSKISFWQALSITGYSLFPIMLAVLVTYAINIKLARVPVVFSLVGWAIWSASRRLGFAGVTSARNALATYPLSLYYFCLGWICVLV